MQPFHFFNEFDVATLRNICILWSWNLRNIFKFSFFFCISKTPGEILLFRTFNFGLFFTKIAIFRFRHVLWRHNYITARAILFVCIDWGDQYFSFYTKSKFMEGWVIKNTGRGLQQSHTWLQVLEKKKDWLDEV